MGSVKSYGMSKKNFATLHWTLIRKGSERDPRHHVPVYHEVRRGYPQGPLCKRRALRGHHYVCWDRRKDDERTHRPRALDDEDQGRRATRAQIFRVDWWVYLVIAQHFSADVDLKE